MNILIISIIILLLLVIRSIKNFCQKENKIIHTIIYSGSITKSCDNELILTDLNNVNYKVYYTSNCFPNKYATEGFELTIRKNIIKSGLTGQKIEEYIIESYNDSKYYSEDGFVINVIKI